MSRSGARSICILVHDFGAGGTERIAIRLANAWTSHGREVTILCGSAAGPLRALVCAHVQVLELEPPLVRSFGSRRELGARMAALVDRIQPDLIFIPGNFHVPVIGPLLAGIRDRRPQVVVKASNPVRRNGRNIVSQRLFESLLRHRLRDVDCVVAMAPVFVAELQLTTGHPCVTSIAEPILDDKRPLVADVLRAPAGLVAAGRLVAQKNFQLAIAALAEIVDPDIHLTIFGEGPLESALKKLAARLGVAARVSFPGYTTNFPQELRKARMLLLPSLYEGYPAVAVEALAAGIPVVATECSPAIRDIIRNPGLGTIIRSADASSLAAAIQERLQGPRVDPAQITSQVSHHRIGPIALEYLALFDQLAS